jgi:hypothetical protein
VLTVAIETPAETAPGTRSGDTTHEQLAPVAGCSWCGGSGVWTDPESGERWPCIQCRPGRDGSDN